MRRFTEENAIEECEILTKLGYLVYIEEENNIVVFGYDE